MYEVSYAIVLRRQAELRCEVTEARLGRTPSPLRRLWRALFAPRAAEALAPVQQNQPCESPPLECNCPITRIAA
jgi:hypothetical protein